MNQYRGLVELKNITEAERKANKALTKPPVVERLQEWDNDLDLANIVQYPTKTRPVPVKPLFFDIAWNYIDYPGRTLVAGVNGVATEEEPEPVAEPRKETKRSWFGFGR